LPKGPYQFDGFMKKAVFSEVSLAILILDSVITLSKMRMPPKVEIYKKLKKN
jgi:hypothetical protein